MLIATAACAWLAASCGTGASATQSRAAQSVTQTPTRLAASAVASAPPPTGRPLTYQQMVVGLVDAGAAGLWLASNLASFKETATQDGITLQVADAMTPDLASQLTALSRFTADPTINVIVLDPVQTTGYDDALRAAKLAGKIVIIEDGGIDSDPSLYVTRVAADFAAEGQKAAGALCTLLGASAHKNVVEIGGDPSSPRSIDRATGFREKIGECGIRVVATQDAAGSDPTVGETIMQGFLAQSRDIQGVFAHDDEQAHGAIEAIRAAGLTPGKDIMVVGITSQPIGCGGEPDGLKDLLSGDLGADIESNPMLAPRVYDVALEVLNGGAGVPKWIQVQEGAFFASDGASALLAGRCPDRKY
jgi:galactofuranose transport system substrate-binding protein